MKRKPKVCRVGQVTSVEYVNGKPKRRFRVGESNRYSFFRKLWFGFSMLLIVAILATETLVLFSPKTVAAVPEVRVVEVHDSTVPPILNKIAEAESRNSHFCTEELIKHKLCAKSELGQVLVKGNKDGTVDVGEYGINAYHWGAEATKLGLNIYVEKDNETMAIWIFENHGTEPWYPSKHKWSK